MASTRPETFIIVGAGPVGCVAALYAAARGYNVQVYELRGDLRDPSVTPLNFTKSINLSLSERGINAIKQLNRPKLLDIIFEKTSPMYGRMIHGKKDNKLYEQSQAYDINGRFNRATDRGLMNGSLLDDLESMPNVSIFFNHKLLGADFRRNLAWFEKKPTSPTTKDQSVVEIERSFDMMIGADGAHSAVRYHMMKYTQMSYSQSYIDTLWCEFHIPAFETPNGLDYRLSPEHLHIWPGGSFMFIAIPSLNQTFTATLFLPSSHFAEIDENPQEKLIPFFDKYFPGVARNLITEVDLITQYTTNPHLPLVSIQCSTYHFGSSAVIIGDAAHAMVPFYGQGMNAGLETARVLFEFLDRYPHDRKTALREFTAYRVPDAKAITALAFENYASMASHVKDPLYKLRKLVEEYLYKWLPTLGWATQYSRVSFSNERYSSIQQVDRKQKLILRTMVGLGVGLIGSSALVYGLCRSR